jgi:hypothetical protein
MRLSHVLACAIPALLATSVHATGLIGVGTGEGSNNWNYVHKFPGLATQHTFAPFGAGYTGGVRVALGDVNNDGAIDYVSGAGTASTQVIVHSGTNLSIVRNFTAYSGVTSGVYVGAGDVNQDGYADIVTGVGAVSPHVKVFDGQSGLELFSFLAYAPTFSGGVRVAAGDINGDGYADIITGAGTAGSGHVKAFSGQTGAEIRSFFAYPSYSGGVFVGSGDVNGDGLDDIITGTDTGVTAHVKVFSGLDNSELRSFFAYGALFTGGVRVAGADINGDGLAEIITGAGPGGLPHVKAFDGATNAEIASFFSGTVGDPNGVYVAAAIPEPASLAILAAAMLPLLHRRRK